MPVQATSGAASYDAFGGGVPVVPAYIEEVFQTWLHTGDGWYEGVYNGIGFTSGLNLIPGQPLLGGFFAGFISTSANGVATHALIVAPASGGQSPSNLAFGASGIVTGITSVIDGPANSAALASIYSSPAALFCENLTLNGYSDWYLPARFELEIAYPTFKPTTTSNSGSGGANAYAVPARTLSYSATGPAQTTIASFISGASNAFSTQENWTSTESNANEARIIEFSNGTPNDNSKTSTRAVRAFRRVAVSDASLDPYRVTGSGGLAWIKNRAGLGEARKHILVDTVRGGSVSLSSNSSSGNDAGGAPITFLSNGFVINGEDGDTNRSPGTYVSWTFREAPKFFDVVTWTGDGASPRTIAHSLGSTPGCIIIKRLDDEGDWKVHHRSIANIAQWLRLDSTLGLSTNSQAFTSFPDANSFYVGNNNDVNASGGTYVAYLFAHDAGGFGLTGTDNVISCGSYTGAGTVDLGYEPQWVMYKRTESTGPWYMNDTMRGFPVSGNQAFLYANSSDAESSGGGLINLTSTGFTHINAGSYIYIAIRRGPMKVPTDGTSVFSPNAVNAVSGTQVNTGFTVDMQMGRTGPRSGNEFQSIQDRLRGISTNTTASGERLFPNSTDAENSSTQSLGWGNTGFQIPPSLASMNAIFWNFRRAPGFFDEVCYTGTGASLSHNLNVVPELIITKARGDTGEWRVTSSATTGVLSLNTTNAKSSTTSFQTLTPCTTTTMNLTTISQNTTNVAYLFASAPGVSKVGSYTGTGTTQTINCGFTGGARFVMVKRTDSTGDWYVWDSARGIIAGDDPYLLLNSTAAEVTNTDYVDTASTGFEISSTAPAAINASGGTFIFLAIA